MSNIYNDSKNDKRFDFPLSTPGPFVATVMNHLDQNCMGRLQVWIPELSGQLPPSDKTAWIKVDYATPFYGTTLPANNGVNSASTAQSYGMWFVPPDIGVQVLVMFANNDPNRGFWFACVPDQLSNHMIPGIAGRKSVAPNAATNDPVTEYDKVAANKKGVSGAQAIADPDVTPTHVIQQKILQTQGLDKDIARGIGISTIRRETPSNVFGISTPGRVTKRLSDDIKNSPLGYQAVTGRYGGHQFVMDDGNALGDSQLIKLRSAQGGTIMINDTIGSVYVINQSGTAWVELSANGRIDIYGKDSISVHSEKDINFTADNDINFFASNNLNIVASQINTDANTQLHHSSTNFYTRAPDIITESDSLTLIAQKGQGKGAPTDQDSTFGSGLVIVADNGDLQFAKFENGKPKVGEGNFNVRSFTGTATIEAVTGTHIKSLTNVTLHSIGKTEIYAKGGIYEDVTALPFGFGSVFLLVQVLNKEMQLISTALNNLTSGVTSNAGYITECLSFIASLGATPVPTSGSPLNPVIEAGALASLPNPVESLTTTGVTAVPGIAATIVTVMRVYSITCNWHAGVTDKIKDFEAIIRTSNIVPIPKPYLNDTTTGEQRTQVPITPQHEPWAGHDINMSDSAIDIKTGLNTGDAMFTTGKGIAFPAETTKIVAGNA